MISTTTTSRSITTTGPTIDHDRFLRREWPSSNRQMSPPAGHSRLRLPQRPQLRASPPFARAHMTTRYVYNSIKQLVEQQNPDGDIRTTTPKITPLWYNAVGSWS